MARTSGPITPEQLTVVPASEASWDDLVDRLRPHRVEEETCLAYCTWPTLSEALERELAD
jgi:hypothetical protein